MRDPTKWNALNRVPQSRHHPLLAGRLAIFGLPVPINIGAMSIRVSSINKVEYVGFSGPLFLITAGEETYQLEARNQAERNHWVSAIKAWMRCPTGLQKPPPPPRPAPAVTIEHAAEHDIEEWQSVEITSTETADLDQFVELDFGTSFVIEPRVVQCS